MVSYTQPSATDAVDPTPTVACVPSPGATFPIATTTVTCTATDDAGNSSAGTFTVTVQDTTAPVLTVPGNMTKEATGPGGAIATFTPSATDWLPFTIACTPPSGAAFPLGTTTVSCTASDTAAPPNQSTDTFEVTVRDTIAPTLTVPAAVVAEATSSAGTVVGYPPATAADAVDTTPTVACGPSSGSAFPLGTTTVSCTATDDAGNSSAGSFTVRVQDTTAPIVTVPSAAVFEANGPTGSTATYTVTASDLGAPLLPAAVTCTPSSGALYPLGTTTVGCTATDASANVGSASFGVTVRDTTPPTITAADINVGATSKSGIRREDPAMALYLRSLRATDLVSSATVTTSAPDVFPVGTTPLIVTASDAAGNGASRKLKVTVLPLGQAAPPPPDLDPPADPTRVRVTAGDHSATLTWVPPRTDLAAVEAHLSVAGSTTERLVYRGTRQRLTVRGLRNDVQHRFLLVSVDKAGNRSRGVVALVTPRAVLLASPKPGARLARPPLLRWVPVSGASYFNVQLYRGKTKLLSAWPVPARLQLRKSWSYAGSKRALAPGTYTWYVWPGLGARAEARLRPAARQEHLRRREGEAARRVGAGLSGPRSPKHAQPGRLEAEPALRNAAERAVCAEPAESVVDTSAERAAAGQHEHPRGAGVDASTDRPVAATETAQSHTELRRLPHCCIASAGLQELEELRVGTDEHG